MSTREEKARVTEEGVVGSNKKDDAASSSSDAVAEKKKKMFFTTSDLMNRMNAAIKENDSALASNMGGFELQRKLPNGSYRPADNAELAAADFQTKMKQAAEVTSMLTPQQKLQWAKYQRKEGNKIFADGEYKEAMDIYLTCLVAMDQSSKLNEEFGPVPSAAQIEEEIKLPVLLNLALCALKLGMLSKAEKFCNYAIEMESGQRSVKANFRRGRTRMLMGDYCAAELDFARALELNDEIIATTEDCNSREVQTDREVILREREKLFRLVTKAEKNKETQKKAMERVFQSTSTVADNDSSLANATNNDYGLYPEKRPPKKHFEQQEDLDDECQLSCFELYVRMIGRCAQKLLDIIGEEEGAEEKKFLTNSKKED
jgi:tetratricopeptide (TPR) repeat protein